MKKAKIELDGQTYIIGISEDIDYKFRIIEELSGMALENDPMLHPKPHLEGVPYAEWPQEEFYDETYEKIEKVLMQKEDEFYDIFTKHIIKSLSLKLKKDEFILLEDSFQITQGEEKENITIHYTASINRTKRNNMSIKQLVKDAKKEIDYIAERYRNAAGVDIEVLFLGNKETSVIFGIHVHVMLYLGKKQSESIRNFMIGFVPDDIECYNNAVLCKKNIDVSNFNYKSILSDVDELIKKAKIDKL